MPKYDIPLVAIRILTEKLGPTLDGMVAAYRREEIPFDNERDIRTAVLNHTRRRIRKKEEELGLAYKEYYKDQTLLAPSKKGKSSPMSWLTNLQSDNVLKKLMGQVLSERKPIRSVRRCDPPTAPYFKKTSRGAWIRPPDSPSRPKSLPERDRQPILTPLALQPVPNLTWEWHVEASRGDFVRHRDCTGAFVMALDTPAGLKNRPSNSLLRMDLPPHLRNSPFCIKCGGKLGKKGFRNLITAGSASRHGSKGRIYDRDMYSFDKLGGRYALVFIRVEPNTTPYPAPQRRSQ